MIERPMFKAHLASVVIPGDGVLLLAERHANVLRGKVFELLAPLLDGRSRRNAIVDALADQVDASSVYYALDLLERNGHISEASPRVPTARAAYWSGMGADASRVVSQLRAGHVSLSTVGDVDGQPLKQCLQGLGVQVLRSGVGAALQVVLTDDYLRADLLAVNEQASRALRPWLVVKPVGHEIWLGPMYRPGLAGCHLCLTRKLKRHRLAQRLAMDALGLREPPAVSRAVLTVSTGAALNLAAIEIVKQLVRPPDAQYLESRLLSLDLRSWQARSHTLTLDPECPVCGSPRKAQPLPVTLARRPISFRQDGGYRSVTPEHTLRKYQHLVSPITGVVGSLERVHDEHSICHVYLAGENSAFPMNNLDTLAKTLRTSSSGKGVTDIQAKTGALCEAIERYSGEYTGNEVQTLGRLIDFAPDEAVHPNAVMCFSQSQYANREAWNAKGSMFNRVPEPFDSQARIAWTPVWSLTRRRFKLLPTQLLYYGTPASREDDRLFCIACSNGSASGNNLEEAVLQGLFELVERDAVALWWYSRARRPAVDLQSFGDPYFVDLVAWYTAQGRELWALDITSDLGIPTFAAVSRRRRRREEQLLIGLGCHLDACIALQRALTELNQMLGMAGEHAVGPESMIEDPETLRWLRKATVASEPYLVPDPAVTSRRRQDYLQHLSTDLRSDINGCRRRLERLNMEMLVLDQTRADTGMPVAKVIVPGLRHFWARFAPGRLFDVPCRLAWVPTRLREDQLNPVPVFF